MESSLDMDNNIQKGHLKRWDDAKAFGFIKPEDGKRDVFIHITALKGMSRRPIVGDTIFFNTQTDKDGKQKAFNARIDGVEQLQTSSRKISTKQDNCAWLIKLLIYVSLFFIAFYFYTTKVEDKIAVLNTAPSVSHEKTIPKYTCSGKIHCSQMTSCEEATFYQNSCHGTKMDGDGDGVPCEMQWCN